MKCFFHDDMDGRAAAFCVHGWVGIRDEYEPKFICINYNQCIDMSQIAPKEQVWIVDFSISCEEMEHLLSITENITWIDHHKTAIERFSGFKTNIRGVRDTKEAACVLTWKYIHWWTSRGEGPIDLNKKPQVGLEVPLAIDLVGDRDIWAFKHGDMTRFFHTGAQCYDTLPNSEFWWKCLMRELQPIANNEGNVQGKKEGDEFFAKVLDQGKTVEQYRRHFYEDYRAVLAFETRFEGHSCLAMNVARVGSEAFGKDAMDKYEILLPFYFDGKIFTVSLYSKTVDVSEIAKKYLGGGHKGAAGFQCQYLPFGAR